MRRYILIFVLSLVALAVVSTGAGWYLLQDEAFLKSQLRSQTLKYTGRDLTLNGPVQLNLGRVTTLEARDVHFANAAWADQPDMVTAGHLKISIDLSSLFDDQIIFPAVSLDEVKVRLVRNEQGEPNWDMSPNTEPEAGPSPPSPRRKNLPLVLRDLKISNSEIYLASLKLEEPLDIRISQLAMQHLENDRWQSKMVGSLNEQPLSLDGWFAPFDALILGGPLDHDLNIGLGKISLQSSGSLKDVLTMEGANLTTRIQGPDIETLLVEFKLPPFSEGAFDYQLKLNTEGKMTKLDFDGDLGSVDIKANGELDQLLNPRDGNVQLSIDGPNLGALAKVFGIEGLVEDAFSHESHAVFKGDEVHFNKAALKTDSDHLEIGGHFNRGAGFAGTELTARFRTDEVGRWTTVLGKPKQKLGPLELDASLSSDSNGLMSIKAKVTQDLTNLDVEGSLGQLPDALQPDLQVVFNSPDPSHLAAIAGFQMIPAAPLAIQGRFGFNDKQIQLGKVRVDLAGDLTDIDGTINLSDRYAGSDLNLQVDVKNAGDLGRLFGREGLPEQPIKLGAELKPEGNGLAFKVTDGNLGDIQLELDGRIPDLEQPLMVDGNFDIKLPRLNDVTLLFPKIKLPDAPFSARGTLESKDNAVQLNKLFIDLAGDTATINGLLKLDNHYAGSDLRAEVDIKSLAALGRLFGQDGLPDEPYKVNLEVKPNGKGMAFELNDGGLRDARVAVKGQIADLDHPMIMDADFDIQLPKLSEISFLFPDKDLPDTAFTAKGHLRNQKTRTRVQQVNLDLGEIKATVNGDLLVDNRFDLSINVGGPDASALAEIIGQPMPAEPFSVSTKLAGSPAELNFTDLDAKLGKSQANGKLTVGLGDVTKIRGQITSPHLDLSHWMPKKNAGEAAPKPKTKKQWMFDDTPVMDWMPQGLDVDSQIQVSNLILSNTTLSDFELGLKLYDQYLRVKPLSYQGQRGGKYVTELQLDGRGSKPKLLFTAHGKDIRTGFLSAPGQDPSSYPPVETEMTLDGRGATRREMASSLNGRTRIYLGSGKIANAGLDLFFSDFLTQLISTLNPFSKNSEYTQLDCAVMAAEAESGVVTVFPVIYQTEHLTILSEGTVDLNTEKIDLAFNTKPRKGIGLNAGTLINPLIKVGGRLTAPAVQMDAAGGITSGGLAVATLGISVLAKSFSDRFLSSQDPCGEARKELEKRDSQKK